MMRDETWIVLNRYEEESDDHLSASYRDPKRIMSRTVPDWIHGVCITQIIINAKSIIYRE